jgi:ribosomal protein L37AE/L43A
MDISESRKLEDERWSKLTHDYGFIRYTGEDCTKCGRNRVELCRNGKRICEKCHWDQDAQSYSSEHMEIHG